MRSSLIKLSLRPHFHQYQHHALNLVDSNLLTVDHTLTQFFPLVQRSYQFTSLLSHQQDLAISDFVASKSPTAVGAFSFS